MAYSYIIFMVLFGTAFAELVQIKSCENVDQEICTISDVSIDPCPTYKTGKCLFKKGKEGVNASLSFNFTPNFSADKLKTMVYWANGVMDVAFSELGSDIGCDYTPCPTETGKIQQFNYQLNIGPKINKGTYEFKWKVWDEFNTANVCCFMTSVKIKK